MRMTTDSAVLFTCAACKVDVKGVVLLEVVPDLAGPKDEHGLLPMQAKITGLRVAHNCLPAHTRVRDSKPKAAAKK